MSAAKRVAHAAETVRARWEQQVSTDPQTEAAQALEDTGQLLDPEVAAELVAFRKERELAEVVAREGALPMPVGSMPRTLDVVEDELTGVSLSLYEEELLTERLRRALASAKRGRARLRARVAELEALELGDLDGRVSATCAEPSHPTWLRLTTDVRGCPWCRIAELEAERHSTNEALSDAAVALRADREGPALPWAASMDDGDLSMFLDDMVSAAMGRWRSEPEVPDRTVLADIEKVCADWRTPGQGLRGDAPEEPLPDAVSQSFAPVPALREVPSGETDPGRRAAWRMLSREEPHDSPLHQAYRVGHDLPELGGA